MQRTRNLRLILVLLISGSAFWPVLSQHSEVIRVAVWDFKPINFRPQDPKDIARWIRDDVESMVSVREDCIVINRDTVDKSERLNKQLVDYKIYGTVERDPEEAAYKISIGFENQKDHSRKSCSSSIPQNKIDVMDHRREILRSLINELMSIVLGKKDRVLQYVTQHLERWEPLARNVITAYSRERDWFNGIVEARDDLIKHIHVNYDSLFYIPFKIWNPSRKDSIVSFVHSFYHNQVLEKKLDEIMREIEEFNDAEIHSENDWLHKLNDFYNYKYLNCKTCELSKNEVAALQEHVGAMATQIQSGVHSRIANLGSKIRAFIEVLRNQSSSCD